MNKNSAMSYRGFVLTLYEGTEFRVDEGDCAYVVSSEGKMTFAAISDVGVNYSNEPNRAVADHHKMIDRHLSSRNGV
jgi:hypothetical protein